MRQSRRQGDLRLLFFAALVLLIGYLDYVTGPNISLTLLYLVPVVGAGWTLGQRRAIVISLFAGGVSLVDASFSSSAVGLTAFVWNAVSRTVILGVAAISVDRMRLDRERLLLQDVQRARSLELLDRGLTDPARHLVELAEHWDGSTEELKKLVRRRADEIAFLARDFSAMVRLQSGELPLHPVQFDFAALIDEIRSERSAERRILLTGPSGPLAVLGDRARTRQSLDALISERAAGDELSFLLDRRGDSAELVITSGDYRPSADGAAGARDGIGISAEMAQLLFAAQGGSVKLARNPLTRSLRVTARLPLA